MWTYPLGNHPHPTSRPLNTEMCICVMCEMHSPHPNISYSQAFVFSTLRPKSHTKSIHSKSNNLYHFTDYE